VERRFAELTNRKLRRCTHRSIAALESDVKAWIEAWNADPKPFVWTRTADGILETAAAYCQRINDSDRGVQAHIPRLRRGMRHGGVRQSMSAVGS
jgi:hypothetical protein